MKTFCYLSIEFNRLLVTFSFIISSLAGTGLTGAGYSRLLRKLLCLLRTKSGVDILAGGFARLSLL